MKELHDLIGIVKILKEDGDQDNPPGGDYVASVPATPDSAPPNSNPQKTDQPSDDTEPEVPEEAVRQQLEDALEDKGVLTVLLRQEAGNDYWDMVFPDNLALTLTFAKVAPNEGEEAEWAMLILTPNEVFSKEVEEEHLEDDVPVLPDALDLEYVNSIVTKFVNADYQIECYSLEQAGSVGDLGKRPEKPLSRKVKMSSYRRKKMVM